MEVVKLKTDEDWIDEFNEAILQGYSSIVPLISRGYDKINIVGFGASYICGLVAKELFEKECKKIISVYCRENFYNDSNTLNILISYSGNTKELLNAYKNISNSNILIITSGGKLAQLGEKKQIPIIYLPKELHQRFTFNQTFFSILKFFEKNNLIINKANDIDKLLKTLNEHKSNLIQGSFDIAKKIKNKTPLFYSTNSLYPAAYRLQTMVAEDAKILCHSNKFTELFHSELETLPNTNFYPILLINEEEIKNYKKQLTYFKKHVKHYAEIKTTGSLFERLFTLFYFTDYLGLKLAKEMGNKMGITPLTDEIKIQ
jgi:bifunctional phosphoglucose/phosphomannose isomerase